MIEKPNLNKIKRIRYTVLVVNHSEWKQQDQMNFILVVLLW